MSTNIETLTYENEKFIDVLAQGKYIIALSANMLVVWENFEIFHIDRTIRGDKLYECYNRSKLIFYLLCHGNYSVIKWDRDRLKRKMLALECDVIAPIDDDSALAAVDCTMFMYNLKGEKDHCEFTSKIKNIKMCSIIPFMCYVNTNDGLFKCTYNYDLDGNYWTTDKFCDYDVSDFSANKQYLFISYNNYINQYDGKTCVMSRHTSGKNITRYTILTVLFYDDIDNSIKVINKNHMLTLVSAVIDKFVINNDKIVYMFDGMLYLVNRYISKMINYKPNQNVKELTYKDEPFTDILAVNDYLITLTPFTLIVWKNSEIFHIHEKKLGHKLSSLYRTNELKFYLLCYDGYTLMEWNTLTKKFDEKFQKLTFDTFTPFNHKSFISSVGATMQIYDELHKNFNTEYTFNSEIIEIKFLDTSIFELYVSTIDAFYHCKYAGNRELQQYRWIVTLIYDYHANLLDPYIDEFHIKKTQNAKNIIPCHLFRYENFGVFMLCDDGIKCADKEIILDLVLCTGIEKFDIYQHQFVYLRDGQLYLSEEIPTLINAADKTKISERVQTIIAYQATQKGLTIDELVARYVDPKKKSVESHEFYYAI